MGYVSGSSRWAFEVEGRKGKDNHEQPGQHGEECVYYNGARAE